MIAKSLQFASKSSFYNAYTYWALSVPATAAYRHERHCKHCKLTVIRDFLPHVLRFTLAANVTIVFPYLTVVGSKSGTNAH